MLDDQAIYFIEKGSVQIFVEEKSNNIKEDKMKKYKTLKILKPGDSFGEFGFFTVIIKIL